MKRVALALLKVYQLIISPSLKGLLGMPAMCRYSPSCSEYARIAIIRHGVLRGSLLTGKRLLTCHPFAKPQRSSL
jgi:putative membrane protein insertion efficiency factor